MLDLHAFKKSLHVVMKLLFVNFGKGKKIFFVVLSTKLS